MTRCCCTAPRTDERCWWKTTWWSWDGIELSELFDGSGIAWFGIVDGYDVVEWIVARSLTAETQSYHHDGLCGWVDEGLSRDRCGFFLTRGDGCDCGIAGDADAGEET